MLEGLVLDPLRMGLEGPGGVGAKGGLFKVEFVMMHLRLSPPNHARGSVEWGSGALATRLLEGGGVLPGLKVWGRRPRVSQGVHRALLVATRVCVEFWGAKAGQALLVCAAARVLLVCAASRVLQVQGGELVNQLTEPVECLTELIDQALAQGEILESIGMPATPCLGKDWSTTLRACSLARERNVPFTFVTT